jgi:transcriptional regulator with XRE-family HTH domain
MLAEVRLGRRWSIREAARRAKCSPGTIVHLEQARRAPSMIMAMDIADGYELDDRQTDLLLAEAVDNAGRSSPYKRQDPHVW